MGIVDKFRGKIEHRGDTLEYNRPPMPLPREQEPLSQVSEAFKTLEISDQNTIIRALPKTSLNNYKKSGHPVPLPRNVYEDFLTLRPVTSPIQTNSFYTNILLDDQTAPVWTHPYALWYTNKPDETQFYGLAISHTTKDQRVFGQNANNPLETQYFFNPAGIKSLVLSAVEFDRSLQIAIDQCEKFSCNLNLFQNNGFIQVPLVQGMGFVTGVYSNLTPKIQSAVGIQNLEKAFDRNGITKYIITLFNQIKWSLYVSSHGSCDFRLQDPNCIIGNVKDCIIQVCSGVHPGYDAACGGYPVSCKLEATVQDDIANYSFNYKVKGTNGNTLIYALPHHVESFVPAMRSKVCQGLNLDSTIAGPMQLYVTDNLQMSEKLPLSIKFEPWCSIPNSRLNSYTPELLNLIRDLCLQDINDDVFNISNTDSMYSSGKILDKYCMVLYVIVFILRDENLGKQYLPRIKDAMIRFTSNRQQCPLVYDTTWKGLVSSAGMDGDIFRDFGNTHYNDHHFHYGYHIHAASVLLLCDNKIGDGSFVRDHQNSINLLVKDVCNPVKDSEFPESRSFDWFNGHSWAKGLFASFDGKDEESSSEDYHFAYGVKLWGVITGNKDLEMRGNLILAIMRRAMNLYMLFKDDNRIQPPQLIKNKVSGILFENKIDHATYFGLNLEYIQGIHMLPITPISSFIRDPEFVRQEWEQLLQNHVKTLDDGWKGILMLNLALYDPKSAWNFFKNPNFNKRWLDNGMSLSWCLLFCAGVGGSG